MAVPRFNVNLHSKPVRHHVFPKAVHSCLKSSLCIQNELFGISSSKVLSPITCLFPLDKMLHCNLGFPDDDIYVTNETLCDSKAWECYRLLVLDNGFHSVGCMGTSFIEACFPDLCRYISIYVDLRCIEWKGKHRAQCGDHFCDQRIYIKKQACRGGHLAESSSILKWYFLSVSWLRNVSRSKEGCRTALYCKYF